MDFRETTVRGVPMRCAEQGDGFPVVLLHGIPTGPSLWRDVMPGVRGRCLAWEMVGYGDSIPAGRQRDLSVARQAEYLLAWLADRDIDRAVFAGHDLGGGVATIAALRERQRCAGLVLTNAVGYDSWPIPLMRVLAALAPLASLVPTGLFARAFPLLIAAGHDRREAADEAAPLHLRPYAEHDGAAALARQATWLHTRDTLQIADELPTLRVPSRVVWGAADPFQKVAYGERYAWDLGCELQRIEDGRHFTPEDHPDAIADAINEVVTEASGG